MSRTRNRVRFRDLIAATHPAPALAVTVLAALLTVTADLNAAQRILVVAAVGSGQLFIGWSNDLIDAARDAQVGRSDKPLATGELDPRVARRWCLGALVATTMLSLATGWVPGLAHLVVVASGWAYNAGLKATVWSWLPYATAFGALPGFVMLVGDPTSAPPAWALGAGALLGVGAHFVNVLPDLDEDAATGVAGLPHRIGARWTPVVAVAVLGLGSLVVALGAPGLAAIIWVPGLLTVAALTAVALRGVGERPFAAAIGIAVVDVTMLVLAS